MAKGAYIGVDGKARKVKGMYIGVDGKARKVKKAYVGVNGVAKQVYNIKPTVEVSGSNAMVGQYIRIKAGDMEIDDNSLFGTTCYSFPVGTVISCTVGASEGKTATVTVNGEIVASVTGKNQIIDFGTTITYDYTLKSDVFIEQAVGDGYGTITITEQ